MKPFARTISLIKVVLTPLFAAVARITRLSKAVLESRVLEDLPRTL